MNEKERLVKMKFLMKWEQPKGETERKKNLIKQKIVQLGTVQPFYEQYFQTKHIKGMIAMCYSAARLPMVKDTMLMDFVKGLSLIPFAKDVLQWKEIDRFMNPVTNFLMEFLSTEVFRDNIIGKEISGDEIIRLKNIDIPLSKEAIKLHIERRKFLPLTPEDIANIQKDLVKYKLDLFDDSTEKKVISIVQERVVEQPKVQSKCESHDESTNPTRGQQLKTKLSEYGFFELENISTLSVRQQDELILMLINNIIPYQIAMLHFLGFISSVMQNWSKTRTQLFRIIAKILSRPERSVAGNIRSLDPKSGDKVNYTAYQKLDVVKIDYERLKNQDVF